MIEERFGRQYAEVGNLRGVRAQNASLPHLIDPCLVKEIEELSDVFVVFNSFGFLRFDFLIDRPRPLMDPHLTLPDLLQALLRHPPSQHFPVPVFPMGSRFIIETRLGDCGCAPEPSHDVRPVKRPYPRSCLLAMWLKVYFADVSHGLTP